MSDIESIINPKSIAIVGATNRPGSVGLAVFKNLLQAGYKGVLYPVNPKAMSIQGVKSYPRLVSIPDPVDMAVIIVPSERVASVVEEAAYKKIRGCIVITAGFKEVGGRGIELEKELRELASKHGIRLVGPNCLGIINTNNQVCMNASFARVMPSQGNIAFISQSGALCTSVLDVAAGKNIGFSKFVSFGNKTDVNEVDFLRYLKDDPDTDVILLYLEDITEGRAFMEVSRQITLETGKPILALKSGRSAEGAKAAASHTGSLAGSDTSYDALFEQSGIQRVEGVTELFYYAQAFSMQPLPRGRRVAIVTNAGGPGIMATDAAIRHGLKLAELSRETKDKLKDQLPDTASIANPVDVIGDATHDRYEAALRTTLMDDGVDCAIVILTPQAMTDILETAEIVPRVAKAVKKPILCSFMGLVDVSEGVRYLAQNGIPNYELPEGAVRSMAAMVRFAEDLEPRRWEKRDFKEISVDKDRANRIIKEKLAEKTECYLPEKDASEILSCYGFPMLKSSLVQDISGLESALKEIGLPVAMKIDSPDIIHKSDAGGVRLKIKTVKEARKAFEQIIENAKAYRSDVRITGVLVEEMAESGMEAILGATRDPKFGPMCMFGLGGIFVEAMKDVTFRLAPMWESSAEDMIQSIKAYKVLKGVRGNPPSDTEALKDCLLRLSQLVSEHHEIKELDINPLIIYSEGKGCRVADARILLSRPDY